MPPRAEQVLDLVSMARTQLRAGFGGAYGLDWNVLARLADDLDIETDEWWWQLVATAERELIVAVTPKPKDAPPEG